VGDFGIGQTPGPRRARREKNRPPGGHIKIVNRKRKAKGQEYLAERGTISDAKPAMTFDTSCIYSSEHESAPPAIRELEKIRAEVKIAIYKSNESYIWFRP